jgi:hypothetical protein
MSCDDRCRDARSQDGSVVSYGIQMIKSSVLEILRWRRYFALLWGRLFFVKCSKNYLKKKSHDDGLRDSISVPYFNKNHLFTLFSISFRRQDELSLRQIRLD